MNMDRIMGVLTLKAPTYREIADDPNATTPAAIIVVVVALIQAVIGAVVLNALGPSLPQTPGLASSLNPVTFAIRTVVTAIIGWFIASWVFAFVSKTFFGGKTNTSEMLRVFGFTQIFEIIGIIPCLGIIGVILAIIGAIIGIREASEFDTTKAILTGIVGFIAILIVSFIITAILAAVGLV